jgi:hypothetical protein
MEVEGQKALDRKAKQEQEAARKAAKAKFWAEEVKCVLCQKMVPRKATVLLGGPLKGPACKTHPGVKDN